MHLVEAMHAGRRLLGDALDAGGHPRPLRRVGAQRLAQQRRARPRTRPNRPSRARARRRAARTRRPCARAASRRRRRRGSCSGRRRPASRASARCTTSTPRASRPSTRRPGRPCGSSTVPSGPTATAAAAWSWVEKMLHDAQRTSAPSSTSVSMSTAVWIVMCSEPEMRAPASGLLGPNSARSGTQAGHLVLGEVDLLAAEGARERSATRKSRRAGGCISRWSRRRSLRRLSSRPVRDPAGQDPASDCLDELQRGDGPRVDARAARPSRATRGRRRARGRAAGPSGPSPSARTSSMPPTTSSSSESHEVEAAGELGMLVVVAQVHEGEHLAGHVAVLAPAATSLWHSSGTRLAERRRLGVLVDLAFQRMRGHRPERPAAVDDRHRAPDAPGERLGGVVRSRELVAPTLELVDGGAASSPRARGTARSARARAAAAPRARRCRRGASGCRRDAEHRAAPLLREARPARRPRHTATTCAPSAARLGRGLDGLLGVARERDREDQRALPDEAGQLVVLRRRRSARARTARRRRPARRRRCRCRPCRERPRARRVRGRAARRCRLLDRERPRRPPARAARGLPRTCRASRARQLDPGHWVNVGSRPSASALAISRSCSASLTVSASSISMIGMSSRTA